MQTDNRKIATIAVAALLFIAFFLPWISFLGNFSAWDVVFGKLSRLFNSGEANFKYLLLLFPVSAILAIILEVRKAETSDVVKLKNIVCMLPMLLFIVKAIAFGVAIADERHGGGGGGGDIGGIV